MYTRTCIGCGVSFDTDNYNKKRCKTACSRDNKVSKNKTRNLQRQFIRETISVCPICDINFYPKRKGNLYCTRKCARKAMRLRNVTIYDTE